MIRFGGFVSNTSDGIPRESGDDPVFTFVWCGEGVVFPARAGMIRGPLFLLARRIGIPRESGDDPLPGEDPRVMELYSPRERG